MFKWIYSHYRKQFYDQLVLDFMSEIPDVVSAPAIDWLSDHRVLFEKFLSIQAYHIQRASIQSKKSQDFYDGALVIIRAFLAAVSQRTIQRTTIVPPLDETAKVADEKKGVDDFLAGLLTK